MADTQSEFHDITKPEKGKTDYSQDYYNFVDQVDANLKLSGVIADRPTTANAPDNAWYEATDQNLIYRNDPTNGWIVIGHGDENNPVPEGQYESVSTEEALIDSLRSRREGGGMETVSTWAEDGTGKYVTESDHYIRTSTTKGPLARATDVLGDGAGNLGLTSLGREMKGVIVDGAVKEDPIVLDKGSIYVGSPYSGWEQVESDATGHVIDVQNPDVWIERLVLSLGSNATSSDAALAHRQNAAGELFVSECELLSGNGGYGLLLQNGHEYWINDIQFEGVPANDAAFLDSINDFHGHNWRVEDGDVRFEGSTDLTFNNINILDGTFISNGSSTCERIAAGNILATGSGDGMRLDGNVRRSSFHVTAVGNGDDGINVAGNDIHVSGTAANNGNHGVALGGKRITFVGSTVSNSGNDLQFGSGADQCMAWGWFSSVNRNGTRCLVNGRGINAGDPSSDSGQWSGKSDNAWRMGATIIDTSNEGDVYQPLPPSATNNWVRVSGTAV